MQIRKIEIKSSAKINFGLKVLKKRDDGFHNIQTLFYPINDLYDTLFIEKNEKFHFSCNKGFIPTDETNLVVKALRLVEEKFNTKFNVNIYLDKKIPVGAGMGGGSSNAAAMLASLNDMFKLKIPYLDLRKMALQLGSDVPYFIKPPMPAIGRARGEDLEYLEIKIDKYILIINPGIHISTKEAYSNVFVDNNEINYKNIFKENVINFALLRSKIKNDFEENIFKQYPEIKKLKESLYDFGAEFSLMTGSGSTVFGLFNKKETAEKAASKLNKKYFKFISCPD